MYCPVHPSHHDGIMHQDEGWNRYLQQVPVPTLSDIDQIMHFIRISNIINQRITDLTQMMSLLK